MCTMVFSNPAFAKAAIPPPCVFVSLSRLETSTYPSITSSCEDLSSQVSVKKTKVGKSHRSIKRLISADLALVLNPKLRILACKKVSSENDAAAFVLGCRAAAAGKFASRPPSPFGGLGSRAETKNTTGITSVRTTPTRNSAHTGNTVRGTTNAIVLKSYLGPRDSNSRSGTRSRIWNRRHRVQGGTTSATKLRIDKSCRNRLTYTLLHDSWSTRCQEPSIIRRTAPSACICRARPSSTSTTSRIFSWGPHTANETRRHRH